MHSGTLIMMSVALRRCTSITRNRAFLAVNSAFPNRSNTGSNVWKAGQGRPWARFSQGAANPENAPATVLQAWPSYRCRPFAGQAGRLSQRPWLERADIWPREASRTRLDVLGDPAKAMMPDNKRRHCENYCLIRWLGAGFDGSLCRYTSAVDVHIVLAKVVRRG